MRLRTLALAVALVLAMGAGAWSAALTAAHRDAVRAHAASAAARLAARTAAEVRRDRGGTDGFQTPTAATAPGSARTAARPVRLRIPSIGVDSSLERLHRDARGVLVAPDYADRAGWWSEGVVPGRIGAAVIVGHLDTILGDAVFVRLRALRPGDRIDVRMSDRSTVRFRVDGSHVVRKALFPTDAVYGATPDPELRLITCSEPFDPVAHSYTDNLVVSASERA